MAHPQHSGQGFEARLTRLETRMENIEDDMNRHQSSCDQFRADMRGAITELKVTLAKYSGIAVLIMTGAAAIVQIVIQQVLAK